MSGGECGRKNDKRLKLATPHPRHLVDHRQDLSDPTPNAEVVELGGGAQLRIFPLPSIQAEVLSHRTCRPGERPELGEGRVTRQKPHSAIGSEVEAAGGSHLRRLPDASAEVRRVFGPFTTAIEEPEDHGFPARVRQEFRTVAGLLVLDADPLCTGCRYRFDDFSVAGVGALSAQRCSPSVTKSRPARSWSKIASRVASSCASPSTSLSGRQKVPVGVVTQ